MLLRWMTCVMAACCAAGVVRAQEPNRDPEKAKLVTSDIRRFWEAYDGATLTGAAERFQRHYIEGGSAGVRAFVPGRIQSGRALAAQVAFQPRFYGAIRAATLAVDTAAAAKAAIRKSFRRLAELYPGATFPDVYFVVGRLNAGGTSTDAGLVIGTELYAKSADTPLDELNPWQRAVLAGHDVLPYIVAHELIHYQQPRDSLATSLLARAFREGSADFVGELISGGIINRIQHEYGDAHEAELWARFERDMRGEDVSGWMYQADKAKDGPPDLGYYVGYRIAKAYYDRAPDKKAAVKRILEERDVEALLRESGYAETMAKRASGAGASGVGSRG